MTEAALVPTPTVPVPSAKAAVKKQEEAVSVSKACKPVGPRVTELITNPVSVSKVLKGLSFTALKKVLAVGHYDVKKNIRHIKLGLKKLVSKGTLVQTKGTGTSSSFKLNKNLGETKEKAMKKKPVAKPKKPVAKKPKKVAVVKKSPKKVKKLAATAARKAAKSHKKAKKAGSPKKAGYPKKAAKGSAKAKVVKPKVGKPKTAKPKVAKAKKEVPKKK
ncbi:H101 protein, partial [Catharus fuscescens]|nr:H101 protein [Catharus fuscescens]